MFSVIVACDDKYGIGKNGTLPWYLPNDLRRFRAITNGCNIIMGRKTWESLPQKPLKNRHNIVLSKTLVNKQELQDLTICPDLESALKICSSYQLETIQTYIIGGSSIYNEAMQHPNCRDIIVTRVLGDFSCDTYIDKIPDNYICVFKTEVQKDNNINYITEIWSKPEEENNKIKSNI